MPLALDLTSTLVMGWIFPVATTERATSPRVTFAMRFESMEEPLTSRARAAPAMARTSTRVTAPHIQMRFFFLDAATTIPPGLRSPLFSRSIGIPARAGWTFGFTPGAPNGSVAKNNFPGTGAGNGAYDSQQFFRKPCSALATYSGRCFARSQPTSCVRYLTMFGIAWGVGSLLVLVGLGEGFRSGQHKNMSKLGNDIMMMFNGTIPTLPNQHTALRPYQLTTGDEEALRKLPELRAVTVELGRSDLYQVSPYNNGTNRVIGVEPNYSAVSTCPYCRVAFSAMEMFRSAAGLRCWD